ncbi:uncharacterized protein LOC131383742 [Hylobates moloch]|uniref:uncharacterized protein LOC131383742 n=1 Tax=Hylobates moloch TaxID=81572 RepID=UPI0026759CA5|nr:uncharacterized protein LOC131383742 [Hylobates moloch]
MQKPGLFSKQDRRGPEWVGPDVQGPPGARFRARVTVARPGRCGSHWGQAYSESGAGLFRAHDGPDRLQETSACRGRAAKTVPPGAEKSCGLKPGLAGGSGRPLTFGLVHSARGERGGRWEPQPRMRRLPPSAAGPARGVLAGEGLGEGGDRVVDSRESARRGNSSLRDFRTVEGRGGSSPGRRDTEGF